MNHITQDTRHVSLQYCKVDIQDIRVQLEQQPPAQHHVFVTIHGKQAKPLMVNYTFPWVNYTFHIPLDPLTQCKEKLARQPAMGTLYTCT